MIRRIVGGVIIASIKLSGLLLKPFNFVGLYQICGILSRMGNHSVNVGLLDGLYFNVNTNDPYWSRTISRHYAYEPELYWFFSKIKCLQFTFLDCGANHGYWSLIVSSNEMGKHPIIAVEADPETFGKLSSNIDLNQLHNTVQSLNKAVYYKSGIMVNLSTEGSHSAHKIIDVTNHIHSTRVETIAIDDMNVHGDMLVKLDIEGAEYDAIMGAQNVVKDGRCVFIYEDHGSDKSHEITKRLLDEDYIVYFIDKLKIVEILDISQLSTLKKKSSVGYNLIAAKEESNLWMKIHKLLA